MDDDVRKRFEEMESHLLRSDERLLATRDLVHAGMRFVAGMQETVHGLVDLHVRMHNSLENLGEKLDRLADAQRVTEQELQAFIDSMRKGGNGGAAPIQ